MNVKQRRIMIAIAAFIAIMMLYPPFYRARSTIEDYGRFFYDWIFAQNIARVEVGLLFAQFIAVGVIGSIAYFLCADKKK